jgi:hypothetical protein
MPEQPSPTAARGRDPEPDLERFHGDLQTEYGKLVDIVSAFDQRLLTIKGWGVTLSLASLGVGFQQNHYGPFLVAAASGLASWLLEATTKSHQEASMSVKRGGPIVRLRAAAGRGRERTRGFEQAEDVAGGGSV